ncbi:sugar ABC transporter substrate-binding protein [Micromonospora sp. NPDC007271]|uniref:sugar ABC transporter substrate-binding protein n=1 Tax=Micromonospora sp. NPDC007271 TaxID=3154587 RepID=UPI0033CDD757
MNKKLAGALLTAVAVTALSGCSVKRSDATNDSSHAAADSAGASSSAEGAAVPSLQGKKIGISIIGTDHDWDRRAYEGAVAQVKALGGTPIAVQAGRNTQQQVTDLENLLQQKPDAIISILGDAPALTPAFKKISDAGIPLFTIDQPSEYSVNNVTSDNYSIGSGLARQIANDLGGKGNLLVFNGFKSVRVCNIRYNMLQEVLKDYPNIKIIQPELQDVPQGTVEDASRKVGDMLNRYPKGQINAVWACWDIPEVGAAQAVDRASRNEIKVYGIDGDPTAIAMIEDPKSSYTATMAQQPGAIGKASASNVAMYLGGQKDKVESTTYFAPVLVTKDNVAEAKVRLAGN